MKRLNPLEFQTGFLMGIVLGAITEGSLIFIYNGIICQWNPNIFLITDPPTY